MLRLAFVALLATTACASAQQRTFFDTRTGSYVVVQPQRVAPTPIWDSAPRPVQQPSFGLPVRQPRVPMITDMD